MDTAKQVSVFLENKPGRLAKVLSALAREKINVTALTVMDSHEHTVLRFVADDLAKAKQANTKDPTAYYLLARHWLRKQDSAKAIESILESSRQHNLGNGITGVLCYGGGVFLQAIEGGRAAVNELYSHIVADKRHTDVVLLHYEEITERRFGGWTMGTVNLSKLNTSIVLKYSEKPEFDPYAVSGRVSLALLEELMATASIIGRA